MYGGAGGEVDPDGLARVQRSSGSSVRAREIAAICDPTPTAASRNQTTTQNHDSSIIAQAEPYAPIYAQLRVEAPFALAADSE